MVYKGAWKECNVFYCAWGDHNLRKILVFSLRKASFCTLNLEVICALLSCGWEHPAFDSPPSRLTEGGKKRGMNMNKSSGKIEEVGNWVFRLWDPWTRLVKNIKSGEGICKAREEEIYSSYLSLTPESETSVGCLRWVSYCKARNKRYFLWPRTTFIVSGPNDEGDGQNVGST